MSKRREPLVAVIGQACRFPGGAADPDSYWRLLLDGVDAVTEVPADRFDQSRFLHPDPARRGRSYTFAAGVLGDVSGFDAGYFGISAREAAEMDPQQRLLLELTAEAFERAGLPASRTAGSDCAVYVGISGSDYAERRMGDPEVMDSYFMLGGTLSIAANRISYAFDLRGPSMAVDTACSSSLVALHEAVQTLRTGRSGMAVVGGVNLLLSPAPFIGFSKATMLSPGGRCRPFAKGGDGYVRAEGAGVVVLKPLADAERDGDPVLAVIRATGVNTDGRTHGIALPSSASQEALLRSVYRDGHVSPREVSYFETHGTGTAVGDPAEASAIGHALASRRRRDAPLLIGSVKGNLGHLEPAAGMAGMIKGLQVLRHGVVPPSLHAEELNPDIAFDTLNLKLVREPTPLPRGTGPAVVGVNSFGFGGANAHVVLEGYADERPQTPARSREDDALPLVISARSDAALEALAAAVRARLDTVEPRDWPDVAYTAAVRRTHHEHRLLIRARDLAEARTGLDSYLAGALPERQTGVAASRHPKLALVFAGNGAQWAGMGVRLLAEDEAFREALRHVDSVARWRLGWSVTQMLSSPTLDIDDTRIAQPLLFAVQVALVEALRKRGLRFDGAVGHSVGEVAAAHLAGALTLEQAVCVIRERSLAQASTRGTGRMMAVALGEAVAEAEIAARGGQVEVAAVNSPRGVTLSGPTEAVLALQADMKRRGIAAKLLDLDFAFHSALQDPTREGLLESLSDLRPACGDADFFSTVTGGRLDGEALGAEHWWRNVRERVRFGEAVSAMEADGYGVFLEISPAALLQGALRQTLKTGRAISTLTRDHDGAAALQAAVDAAFLAGAEPDFGVLFPHGGRVVDLPTYPWRRERHWYEPTAEAGPSFISRTDAPLLGRRVAPDVTVWEGLMDAGMRPDLAEHRVDGAAVMPAAAYVEMALEAAAVLFGADAAVEIEGLEIQRPLVLDEPRVVRFAWTSDGGFLRVESRGHMQAADWTVHASGRLAPLPYEPVAGERPALDADAIAVAAADHYAFAAERGFAYGSVFQVLEGIEAGPRSARARLQGRDAGPGYRLHPALLDGLLQAVFPMLRRHGGDASDRAFMPHKIARLWVRPAALEAGGAVEVRLVAAGERSVTADGLLLDAEGRVVAELQGVRLAQAPFRAGAAASASVYDLAWEPLPALAPVAAPQEAVVAGRRALEAAEGTGDAAGFLDDLAAAFAADALLALGEEGAVAPGREPLLAQLIEAVETRPDAPPDSDLAWRGALAAHPRWIAELTALGRAGAALPARLQGAPDAPASPMREQVGDDSPALAPARSALLDSVRAFAGAWPRGRRLRVLDASSGEAFPRRLLQALPPGMCSLAFAGPERSALLSRLGERADPAVSTLELDEAPSADETFDLVVCAGDFGPLDRLAARAAPGALLLAAGPKPSPWSRLALGRAAEGPPALPGWREVSQRENGAALLMMATAPRAVPALAAAHGAEWIVIAGPDEVELADAVALAVGARGLGAMRHDPAEPLAALAGRRVLDLTGLLSPPSVEPQAQRCDHLLRLLEAASPSELVLTTRGALPGPSETPAEPAQALVAGFARVLRNERPDVACRLVDLHLPPERLVQALADEAVGGREPEVVRAAAGRFTPRLFRCEPAEPPLSDDERLTLVSGGAALDKLRWARAPRRAPGPGEVEIAVRAAGLNFRDVMFAMGAIPDDILEGGFAGATLGMEAAGIVERVGEGVQGLAPGDRVACFAPASLSTHLVTRASATMRLPQGAEFEEGATLITAAFTVVYALSHLSRLRAGERLLVHGAAGGVGLAALQYARSVGAEVFATAGSDEKREFLTLWGVPADHVLDSRSDDFAAQIRRRTGGEGVDVVLNSLAGEAVHRGLSLLRPFGRFIELGKMDFVANSRVGLRAFRNNIAYHGVDADQLMAERPQVAAEVLAETFRLAAEGVFEPPPCRVFEADEVVDAFRHMQRARHIGKIVVRPPAATPAAGAAARTTVPIRAQGAYLVTGGLSGFGLASARWLAQRGARHLVLAGRKPKPGPEVEALRAEGVRVDVRACDVSDSAAVRRLVGEYAGELRGVVHAAAVYGDSLISELTPDGLRAVLAPKALGALALDEATAELPLDLFLGFSSISALIGNPGQANYAAANLVVEALAASRRTRGRAAQVVELAPVAETGQLGAREGLGETFTRIGVRPLSQAEIFARLDEVVLGGAPGLLIADVKWPKLAAALPAVRDGKFASLSARGGESEALAADLDYRALAASLPPAELLDLLTAQVARAIGDILRTPADKLDVGRSVFDLGMDSLMGLELRMSLEERFGVGISTMALSQDVSIRRIAELVRDQLTGAAPAAGDLAVPDAEREQAHLIARHGAELEPGLVAEVLGELKDAPQQRLIP